MFGLRTRPKNKNTPVKTLSRRWKPVLETLEDRIVPTFTFVYTNTNLCVVNETGAGNDSLTVINNGAGLLEWSTDHGVTFSTQWGALPADTLSASLATTLTINSAGNNSDVILGLPTAASSAASNIFASIQLGPNFNAGNGDRLTIDDSASALGAGTYTNTQTSINSTQITGPNIHVNSSPGFTGGATIISNGSDGNIFNIPSTYQFQPLNIISNALATVNIGSTGGLGTMAGIQGAVSISNPASLTDLIFHDENHATGQTWLLDNNDGVPTGSVAVTGSATTSYNPFDLSSLTVNGGSGGNTFTVNNTSAFFPTTLNSGTGGDTVFVEATGSNTLNVNGQAGQDTLNLGNAGSVQGILGNVSVTNDSGSTALSADDSADPTGRVVTISATQITGLAPATISMTQGDIHALTIKGGTGSDTFTVTTPSTATTNINGGLPVAGDPGVPPGDRLIINFSGATVTPPNSPNGTVVTPGFAPINFTSIETVSASDRLEFNNTPATASFLGSDPTVALANLSISTIDDPATPGVNEADVDFFRYVAHDTGFVTVNAQYQFAVGGALRVDVYRLTSTANLNDPNAYNNNANYLHGTVPSTVGDLNGSTLSFPVVAGQVYYIRVRGVNQQVDVNNYNLEIENFVAASPTVVNLPANLPGSLIGTNDNDTGRSNTDGITNNSTPYFIIQDDLRALANAGVNMLTSAQAAAGQTSGAAVQVFIRTFAGLPIISFFADPVPGTDHTLWSIRSTPLADGNYQITASTLVYDNNSSNGLATEIKRSGPTLLGTPPLNFTIDTVAPAPPSLFLNPPDDSGIPGQPGTFSDNITKYAAANFTGNSESNSWIQFYAVDKTATPQFDGTAQANAFGQYFIDPTFDLNNPAFFNLDGERNLFAVSTDVAGNQSTPQDLLIFLDTRGPQVAGLTYRYDDANGNPVVVNLLDQTMDGTKVATPAISYIDVTLLDQPNRTDNFLYPAANELLATTPGNYAIVGKRTGAATIASVIVLEDDTISGSIGLTTYRLLLSKPLANDQYTFKIFDRIKDQAGNALDGDFQPPFLPSGDGVPGGNFVATFSTANSTASTKLGFYANGSINLDLNGDYIVNPGSTVGTDALIPYAPNGSAVFSGQFYDPNIGLVDGFDRLGTYGKEGTKYVFRLDFNNDGDFSDPGETIVQTSLQINGLPIAGNWGPSALNIATGRFTGSNVGVFTGTVWYLDTNGNNIIESAAAGDRVLKGNMRGLPFTGDFDGDGLTDLGTYQNGVFYLDLTTRDSGGLVTGNTNYTFKATLPLGTSGTASKLARPVAADFDGDGISDIGLFIPNQTTVPSGQASWFLMNSNGVPWDLAVPSGTTRGFKTASTGLGTDIAVTYGSAKGLPVVGNFDPSTRKSASAAKPAGLQQVIANVAHGLTDLYFSSTDSTDFVMGKLRKGKGR